MFYGYIRFKSNSCDKVDKYVIKYCDSWNSKIDIMW